MSSEALLLAPSEDRTPSGTETLAVSRWIAGRVCDELVEAGVIVFRRPPPRLIRESLSVQFEAESHPRGVAFFGHGSTDAVFGDDGCPLLDRYNCDLLAGTWFYAFACRAGVELAACAAPPATIAAGYTVPLIVEFDPGLLSGELLTRFVDFVVAVPVLLATGETDARAIAREVEARAERVAELFVEDPAPPAGIEIALQQLSRRLQFYPPTD